MAKSGGEQKPTQFERETAIIGTRWAEIGDKLFKPVEDRMVKRAGDVETDRRTLRGQASTDFAKNFGAAKKSVTESLTRSGSRPGSGRFNMALSDVERDYGRAAGLGLNDVNAAVEDQAGRNRQAVVDYGMGKAATGAAGLGRAARVSTAQAIDDARASAAARGSIATIAGSAAGIAAHQLGKSAAPALTDAGAEDAPAAATPAPAGSDARLDQLHDDAAQWWTRPLI